VHDLDSMRMNADALKHVAVFTIYKLLLIYIYICVVHLLVWITNCTRCKLHTLKSDSSVLFRKSQD